MGFLLTIFIGALLLDLPIASKDSHSIGFINALFTATSANCVTGLIVADSYSQWTIFGQIVILCLIQIGGLGIMTMAAILSFFLRRQFTFKERILMVESLNQNNLSGIVRLTKHILLGTLMFEGIGAIILTIKFAKDFGFVNGLFKGIFHSISAFCNAGFDLMGQNIPFSGLTVYVSDIVVNLTIMSLIIIGGLGFSVWEDIYEKRGLFKLNLHSKMVLIITAALLIAGTILYFSLELNNPDTLGNLEIKGKVLASMFQSVSPRTAGFNTVDYGKMGTPAQLLTVILMFIGGSPGSTAGGIKTTTLGILVLAVYSVTKGSSDVTAFGRRIEIGVVLRSLAITFISLSVVIISIMVMSDAEPFSFLQICFEVVSAFGTVGLTTGITPHLTSISKIILICLMYFGRVGMLTVTFALLSRLQGHHGKIRYPEGKIMVG